VSDEEDDAYSFLVYLSRESLLSHLIHLIEEKHMPSGNQEDSSLENTISTAAVKPMENRPRERKRPKIRGA
jgi:hypothetical protein